MSAEAQSGSFTQDGNHYSENCLNVPFLIASKDSKAATTVNAWHEPHYSWLLDGFTFPGSLQSADYLTGPSTGGVGETSVWLSGIIGPSNFCIIHQCSWNWVCSCLVQMILFSFWNHWFLLVFTKMWLFGFCIQKVWRWHCVLPSMLEMRDLLVFGLVQGRIMS